jgi:hypothetical protein
VRTPSKSPMTQYMTHRSSLELAQQLGVDVTASEAQLVLLGMYPEYVRRLDNIFVADDILANTVIFRIHSSVFRPGTPCYNDPLGIHTQDVIQTEVREAIVHDDISAPPYKITYR